MESSVKAIKDAIKSGIKTPKDVYLEAKDLVTSVMIKGFEDPFFQEYCIFAQAMGVEWIQSGTMEVAISPSGETNLRISPVGSIMVVNSEEELMFLIAHEVKHLINNHLSKYVRMFKDPVQALFMNIATDVEVNEGLKEELGRRNRHCVPASAWDKDNLGKLLYKKLELPSGNSVTIANWAYALLNQKCKEVLGADFLGLLYQVKISKANFVKEIFNIALGLPTIFELKDAYEAQRFCKELTLYLEYPNSIIVVCDAGDDMSKGFSKAYPGSNESKGKEANPESTNMAQEGEGGKSSKSKCARNGSSGSSDGSEDKEDSTAKDSDKNSENSCGSSDGSEDKEDSTAKDPENSCGSGNSSGKPKKKPAKKKSKSKHGVSVVSKSVSPDELLNIEKTLKETTKELAENIGVKSRSDYGSGSTSDFGETEEKYRLPWQSILKNRMRALSSRKEPTKKRLNRRMPYRLDLSGVKSKKELNIIVGFDESGSVENKELAFFISEFKGIVSLFDCSIHLIEFTSEVENHVYYKKSRDFKRDKTIFKVRYCGGTVAQSVYDYANEIRGINKSRTLVIILTDGYVEANVDFKGFNNRLWVYTGDFNCKNEHSSNVFKLVEV